MKKKREINFSFKKTIKLESIKEFPDRPILINVNIPSTDIRRRDTEECEEYDELIDDGSVEDEPMIVKTKIGISDFCVIAGKIKKYKKRDSAYNLCHYAMRNTWWQLYQENKNNDYFKARYLGSEIICKYIDREEFKNIIIIRKIKITEQEIKKIYLDELKKIFALLLEVVQKTCIEKKIKIIFSQAELKKIKFQERNFFKQNSKIFKKFAKLKYEDWSPVMYKIIYAFISLFIEFLFLLSCLTDQKIESYRRVKQMIIADFINLAGLENDLKKWRYRYQQYKNKIDLTDENLTEKLLKEHKLKK